MNISPTRLPGKPRRCTYRRGGVRRVLCGAPTSSRLCAHSTSEPLSSIRAKPTGSRRSGRIRPSGNRMPRRPGVRGGHGPPAGLALLHFGGWGFGVVGRAAGCRSRQAGQARCLPLLPAPGSVAPSSRALAQPEEPGGIGGRLGGGQALALLAHGRRGGPPRDWEPQFRAYSRTKFEPGQAKRSQCCC